MITPTVVRRAFDEAIRLSDGWVGSEHILLALISHPSIATEILASTGMTYEILSESVANTSTSELEYDSAKGLSGPNPDGQMVVGRAQGFAIAQGVADGLRNPKPEHWLLALLYSEPGIFSSILRRFEVTPDEILEGLRRRGIEVPRAPLPESGA